MKLILKILATLTAIVAVCFVALWLFVYWAIRADHYDRTVGLGGGRKVEFWTLANDDVHVNAIVVKNARVTLVDRRMIGTGEDDYVVLHSPTSDLACVIHTSSWRSNEVAAAWDWSTGQVELEQFGQPSTSPWAETAVAQLNREHPGMNLHWWRKDRPTTSTGP
jgi:hypothetical protein